MGPSRVPKPVLHERPPDLSRAERVGQVADRARVLGAQEFDGTLEVEAQEQFGVLHLPTHRVSHFFGDEGRDLVLDREIETGAAVDGGDSEVGYADEGSFRREIRQTGVAIVAEVSQCFRRKERGSGMLAVVQDEVRRAGRRAAGSALISKATKVTSSFDHFDNLAPPRWSNNVFGIVGIERRRVDEALFNPGG